MTRASVDVRYDLASLDVDLITQTVQASYWGQGRDAGGIRIALEQSFCVGLFQDGRQIAFARAVSDTQYFAYIFDVFVVPDCQGQGFGNAVTQALLDHPSLERVTSWMLASRDAHDMYRKFGFDDVAPGRFMRMTQD